jgi:hypothetical protein
MKKIYLYGVVMIIGLSFIFYGLIQLLVEESAYVEPTDQEIIQRARELGMVGLEERFLIELESDE